MRKHKSFQHCLWCINSWCFIAASLLGAPAAAAETGDRSTSPAGLAPVLNEEYAAPRERAGARLHAASPRQGSVQGQVTTPEGEPLPGVSVIVKGTTIGVATDLEGRFQIDNVPSGAVLLFSLIGFQPQEVEVSGQETITIALVQDIAGLEEIVVTGYGTQKREDVTGAISSISPRNIESFPATNIGDALQGKAAGVFVAPSRMAGEGTTIRIRGERSLQASSDPLVIVDGMPGSLDNINTNDIQSIDVLKDASATAIYGSRAANGVILVTTKSGNASNETIVEVNSYVGMNKFDFIEMQTPEEFAGLIRDVQRAGAYGYTDPSAWENSDITAESALANINGEWHDNYVNNTPYDWQSALFAGSTPVTGHQVSMSGGGEKTTYRVSYSYQQDKSYYKTHNFNKHLINTSLKHNFNDWLSATLISRFSFENFDGYPDDMWENLKRMSPLEHPYDEEGVLKDRIGIEDYVNALLTYEPGHHVDDNKNKSSDFILKFDVKPLEGLTFSTNLKLGFGDDFRGIYYDSRSISRNLGKNLGSIRSEDSFNYTWNNILTYTKSIDDHNFTATLVHEMIYSENEWSFAEGQDIPNKALDYHNLVAASSNQRIESSYSSWSLLSGLARLQYDYAGKYMLTAAVRQDGSSRLAEGNKWATFPSVSLGWRITEEAFFPESAKDVLSNLKLRASYGVVGNQAIDPYQTITKLTNESYSWAGQGFLVWRPDGIANPSLGWEISKSQNFGLDFGLFNHRISGSFELFKTRNEDLLLERQLPRASGFETIWDNVGITENKGFEATVSAYVLDKNNVSWLLTGIYSRNESEIVALPNDQDDLGNGWFIGEALNVWYQHDMQGVWQLGEQEEAAKYSREVGEVKVRDTNGDFEIDEDDKVILGLQDPEWTGSLVSRLNIGQFDMSFTINAMGGYLIRPDRYGSVEYNGDKWILSGLDYWTPLNPSNEFPRVQVSEQSNKNQDAVGFMDGAHAKVQEISLGYSLENLEFLQSFRRCRIYLQAKNAFYLFKKAKDDVHPEVPDVQFSLPQTYVLGINLSI